MKNFTENFPVSQEANSEFEALYKKILESPGGFVEYDSPHPKVKFLEFLTRNKNILLHGSNYDVDELEPRQANCKSKKFGNLDAVYATRDAVLPIFYAIKDKDKFHGMAVSGFKEITSGSNGPEKLYEFEIEPQMLEIQPWAPGIIYILPKDAFEQGVDDNNTAIDEWISRKEVRPLAKLKINPEDFPFLSKVRAIGSL